MVERSDRGNKILDMSSKENRGCFFSSEAYNAVNIIPPVRFIQKDPTENEHDSQLERQHNSCESYQDFPVNSVLLFLPSKNFRSSIKI